MTCGAQTSSLIDKLLQPCLVVPRSLLLTFFKEKPKLLSKVAVGSALLWFNVVQMSFLPIQWGKKRTLGLHMVGKGAVAQWLVAGKGVSPCGASGCPHPTPRPLGHSCSHFPAKSHAGRVTHFRRHSRKKNNYAIAGIDVMVFFRML